MISVLVYPFSASATRLAATPYADEDATGETSAAFETVCEY